MKVIVEFNVPNGVPFRSEDAEDEFLEHVAEASEGCFMEYETGVPHLVEAQILSIKCEPKANLRLDEQRLLMEAQASVRDKSKSVNPYDVIDVLSRLSELRERDKDKREFAAEQLKELAADATRDYARVLRARAEELLK